MAEQEVQAAINAAQTYLPADLPAPPIYSKTNPADAPILTLALTSKTLPLSQVEDLADTRLAQKISQLPGVGLVSHQRRPEARGPRPGESRPRSLRYGINLEDVRAALQQTSLSSPRATSTARTRIIRSTPTTSIIDQPRLRKVVVAYRNGAPVRLSDVANVVDGVENDEARRRG